MQIPNYNILEVIGTGGMATVYRAEHILLKQERALKVMSAELSHDPGFCDSFLSEGQMVVQFKHPNIITIHDIGHSDDGYFMSMELLPGGSLKDLLQHGSLPLKRALSVLQQMGDALQQAHDKGLIHRDIKPANILFRETGGEGGAVLADFGISKRQDRDSDLTKHGYTMIGTPRYMSPEQTGGQVLDVRSDQYSLGLIWYEMLTGKPAIQADSTAQIIHEHALAPPPALPETLTYLQVVLNRALAKSPEERYASIRDFLAAVELSIREHQDDNTVVWTGEPATSNTKTGYWIPAIFLVACSGATGWFWFAGGEILKTDSPVPVVRENSEQKSRVVGVTLPEEHPVLSAVDPGEVFSPLDDQQEQSGSSGIVPIVVSRKEGLEPRPVQSEISIEAVRVATPVSIEEQKSSLPAINELSNKQPNEKSVITTMQIKAQPYAHLYQQPGGVRLGRVNNGTRINVLKNFTTDVIDGEEWKEVMVNGKQGYIKVKDLDL